MLQFYDPEEEAKDFMETIREGYELEMAEKAYTPLVIMPGVAKKRCPYCGGHRVRCHFRLYERGVRFFYYCEQCYLCAPHAGTPKEADAKWNDLCERMDGYGQSI